MNGNRSVLVVIVVLAVLAFGYVIYSNKTAKPDSSPAPETILQQSPPESTTEGSGSGVNEKQVGVSLTAQNNSGQEGTVTLKDVEGKTLVTIKLAGAPKGSLEPAHIHTGACPEPGAVKYPLTNVADGNSETTLDVKLSDLMANPNLAINVHKSQAEIKTYVACGNLTP